jgi:hypothetical protein
LKETFTNSKEAKGILLMNISMTQELLLTGMAMWVA